jgi:hypothetical protein
MDDWLNDWLRNLPGALANDVAGVLLIYGTGWISKWIWKHRRELMRRGRAIQVEITDTVGITDSVELSGTAVGRSNASGILTVTRPKKKLPEWEELLWWYIRLR